uniref:Uncharacterized protein n=1 Tax=Yoonia rhodophyticola TaxID=3137370 RepID=A0AAN0MCL4_9RHOB
MAGAKLMALDAETVIDLAPAGQFGLIDRYLPDPYRRALNNDGDALASLTRTMRGTLRRAGAEIEAVQRSRALAFFNDLTDGRLLGALHDQAPWPEDDVPTFRDRLTRVAGLAMRGAATSDRLLNLAAIACGAAPDTHIGRQPDPAGNRFQLCHHPAGTRQYNRNNQFHGHHRRGPDPPLF